MSMCGLSPPQSTLKAPPADGGEAMDVHPHGDAPCGFMSATELLSHKDHYDDEDCLPTHSGHPLTTTRNSVSGDHTSVPGDHTSVSGDHTSVSGDHTSVSGDHTSVSGDHTSVSGDHTSVPGDTVIPQMDVVTAQPLESLFPASRNNEAIAVPHDDNPSKQRAGGHLMEIALDITTLKDYKETPAASEM